MKKRHQAEEIIRIIRDVESSEVKAEAIKRHGITQQTYYAWRRKYGGMQVDEAKRLSVHPSEIRVHKALLAPCDTESSVCHCDPSCSSAP